MTKICTKCGIEQPISEYHKAGRGKYGVAARCKTCLKQLKKDPEYTKQYRLLHLDEIKEKQKLQYIKNKEKIRNYGIEYRKINNEIIKKRKHERYLKNKKKILEKHRAYAKRTGIYHWRGL
jgi:hypothetical protein